MSTARATTPEEAAAHRRAMTMQRMLSNGMEWSDATELHRRSTELEPWDMAAESIGAATLARAEQAHRARHLRTAAECYLYASAAFRFGHNPLPDDERKRHLYRRMMNTYAVAAELIGGVRKVEIGTSAGTLRGWLHRPAGASATVPLVIILGGFDGWREEYHGGARRLVDGGLAVLLVDGPGQGEPRLFDGVHMPDEPERLDAVLRDIAGWVAAQSGIGRIGVWGNSMGGYLAARFASVDDRIAAVCVNGGTDRPAEILDRFHRFISKIEALYGTDDPDRARELIARHVLTGEDLARVRCPALVLHGEPDRIFLPDSARRLVAGFDGVTTLQMWADGDHCLYNHAHERDSLVADWFVDQLLT